MRKVYWRPREVSRAALVFIAGLSALSFAAVEILQQQNRQPYHREKLAAAHLAEQAFQVIKQEKQQRFRHRLDNESDPTGSGLIGQLMTSVTSNTGSLPAKQTSINPNFAAVVVQLLKRSGLEEGDVVAIGFSGSFPALNVAVMAAVSVLGLKPIIISSNAASQWGANDPEFLWIDWERTLAAKHIFNFRSVAASIGGIEDRGLGMTPEGRRTIVAAIEAAGVPVIRPRNYLDSVEERWTIFHETAGDLPIKAYVNVGGGTTSVGTKVGKHLFKPGLNLHPPAAGAGLDSIMSRFVDDGIPVIHLVNIAQLAKRYGLPTQPQTMPVVGQGKVFSRAEYNPLLAGGSLLVIFGALYAFVRSDLGFRMLRWSRKKKSGGHPEPMV